MDLRQIIADLCSDEPNTSPWWVLSLVEQLPEDSAIAGSVAEINPPTPSRNAGTPWRGWGTDRQLLASIFDAIQAQTIVLAKVNGNKNVKMPDPWPRPGQRPKGTSMKQLVRAHAKAAERRRKKGVNADAG